jgi:hypothetical protein
MQETRFVYVLTVTVPELKFQCMLRCKPKHNFRAAAFAFLNVKVGFSVAEICCWRFWLDFPFRKLCEPHIAINAK